MRGHRPLPLVPSFLVLIACCAAAQEEDDAQGTYALFFGAPGGTVTVASPSIAEGGAALTVELRVKTLAKLSESTPVVSRWAAGSKDPDRGTFSVSVGPGEVTFDLMSAAGKVKSVRAHPSWKDGVWHQIVAVWDGTEAIVYVDGKAAGREKAEGFGPLASSKLPLVIGVVPDAKKRPKGCFEGFLSDVAIWNAAWDAGDVAASVNARLTGTEADLAAFLPLREPASVASVEGLGGAGCTGTLSPALARVGWSRTPWWFEEHADRPWVQLFSCDLSGTPGVGRAWRRILVSNESKGEAGGLWQDETTRKVHVTWVDASLESCRTVDLAGMDGGTLASGTADPKGNLYYLMIQSRERGGADDASLRASLYLASVEGKPLRETALDSSKNKLNMIGYGGRWNGSMAISKGTVCLVLPRQMHRNDDGFQHQSAIAATFGADLSGFSVIDFLSSHSFGNLLTPELGRRVHRSRLGGQLPARSSPPPHLPRDPRVGRDLHLQDRALDGPRQGLPRLAGDQRVVKEFGRGEGGDNMRVDDSLMVGLPRGSASESGGGLQLPRRVGPSAGHRRAVADAPRGRRGGARPAADPEEGRVAPHPLGEVGAGGAVALGDDDR